LAYFKENDQPGLLPGSFKNYVKMMYLMARAQCPPDEAIFSNDG
jgi:hypothetical protein